MKRSGWVLTKLALFLLVFLMAVCGLPAGRDGGGSAAFLGAFAATRGSAVSPSDQGGQDALLQEQYDAAQAFFDAGDYEKALEAFEALGGFSNSRARAADSKRKGKAASYQEATALYKAGQYAQAKAIFEALGSYEKSRSYLYDCTMEVLRSGYRQAEETYAAGEYEKAKTLFEALGRFHDSPKRAQAAQGMMRMQQQAQKELNFYETALALKEAGDLQGARDALIQAGDCMDATEQLYSILHLLALRSAYERAEGYFVTGEYESAYDLFRALEDFEDSPEKAALCQEAWRACVYGDATAVQGNDPSRAYILFLSLGGYRDSAALAKGLQGVVTEQRVYAAADALAREGDDGRARAGFEAISSYGDSGERIAQLSENMQRTQDFQQALFLRATGEEERANAIFQALGDFQNAAAEIAPVPPRFTTKQLRDDQTSPQSPVFTAPDGTKHRYQIYKGVPTWVQAKAFCQALGGHLATLTTAEENAFVHGFMIDSGYLTAYFGLSDEARVGDWVWVTGEPFVYSNWDSGEPSRSARERYGMYFYKHTKGTWNDSHFYEHWEDPGCSFICEWDEGKAP